MARDKGKKLCNEGESSSFRCLVARRDFPPGCGPHGQDAATCQYTPAEETEPSEDSSSLSPTKTRSRSMSQSRSRSDSRVSLGIRSMVGRASLSYHAAARGPYPRSGPTPLETSEERVARIYREYVQLALQLQESQERVNGLLEALRIIYSLIRGMVKAAKPATFQSAVELAGTLTDEMVRCGMLREASSTEFKRKWEEKKFEKKFVSGNNKKKYKEVLC
ncbi:hypothetical protein L1987_33011 [Smallanthus sonchifolius]|uniref:Uncharacterized protein n=1 Tax=Smallanthus sonchifolius TaxID=185202 RepID=A0ACB9HR23_9ASTR|nr:hypothetical protein L1987_33011 [Smallanthus sonchifolius]